MKPPRVVTFGEMLLRLSPPDHGQFMTSPAMSACFGGAEANVAVSLAHLGSHATYITRLPDNLLGDAALKALREEGVDASGIPRGPERMGLYFVDTGTDSRPMRVVYDRAGSAFAHIEPGMVDWSSALNGADWFHSTGITPALGAGPAAVLAEAVSRARAMGIRVSIDLNYREALWQDRDPRPLIEPLVHGADLLVGNPAAMKAMLGVEVGDDASSRAIAERFDCKRVAVTTREVLSTASHRWGATLYDASSGAWFPSAARQVEVVDRVGGGDSFTAALIDRLLRGVTGAGALAFAVAASAMKLRVAGDWNRVSVTDVEEFICAVQDSLMPITFRWFGPDDPVGLDRIRQIPGVTGIVSALAEVPVGDAWPKDALARRKAEINAAGLEFAVVESIPVHEDIKLGRSTRDKLIDHYIASIRAMGALGIPVLCYNFMPVFDWMRTDLAFPLADGSTALAYDDQALRPIDFSRGTGNLPGWAAAYSGAELRELLGAYRALAPEQLWHNLAHFLERVIPEAERAGIRLAIHPDDPPWPIFGLPRIITNAASLDRLIGLVDSPANGITFCTGSLGASAENDLPSMARHLGAMERIHFAHCRNVKRTGYRRFHEVPHPSGNGDVDMYAVLQALRDAGFSGPIRPDHGRMIWGERGRPGYGLHDRALGAAYLNGLWEGLTRGPRS